MTAGLVSTIIPVHNRAALLREAVASVLAQTYRPIEIIIVDDGSTDDTITVADDLAAANPEEIRAIHQNNTGPGLAREAGRQSATGEFLQYLDSDDLLLPKKFELQVAGLKDNAEFGVSYGRTRLRSLSHFGQDVPWKRTGERIDKMFPSLLRSRLWDTSTPLYRRSLTDAAGPWTELMSDEDWEYECRIAAVGARLHYVPEFVSEQRDHSGERLSRTGISQVVNLLNRVAAHKLIFSHARRAGMTAEHPEMEHFARELFLLSRQCGAADLEKESKDLFELAREASGVARGGGWDFRLYGFVASIAGWTRLGKLACYSDGLRLERK